MNQNIIGKSNDDLDCCGPRPPVLPGEESRKSKMTERSGYRDSPPSYLKWARTLASLLEDREGVELFKRYVESEGGIHADRLNFYFACEGLKQQSNPDKVKLMIGAIYRFLRKSQLSIPEDIKRAIKTNLKNENYISSNIYDQMQQDIERIINETTYPNFLRSDIYLQHVQNMQSGLNEAIGCDSGGYLISGSIPNSTSSSSGSLSAQDYLKRSSTLPTLHEDSELVCESFSNINITGSRTPIEMPVKLTRELLLATQERRLEVRPPGAHGYSSVYSASAYASYNPVSLQDSERQSLSSGRTDSDTMSIGSNSMDGGPYIRRQSSLESHISRQAFTNRETEKFKVIPRTLRPEGNKILSPAELFQSILPKLEKIRRQQETNELFERKLQESDITMGDTRQAGPPQQLSNKSKNLADAIREKFLQEDENDQAILDQHVSRVWADLTPSRSPGTMSPYQVNTNRRRTTHDSGFGDMRYTEGASSIGSHYSMKHSKSMPEHASSSSKKLLSNKWPSMNTDSGISVFSTKVKSKEPSREFMSKSRSGLPDSTLTSFQLEEASRRLEDEHRRSKRYTQQQQQYSQPPSTMSATTLQKMAPQEFTTVVFNFCDETVPYRIKIQGLQPTLKQFKDCLPKKGNFKYYFKTICKELDSVIQEQVVNDIDLLPFYEGKVMGVVQPAD